MKVIHRATRKPYSAEEKIRIVLDGLRGEGGTAELCRRSSRSLLPLLQGVSRGGQKCLAGDTAREATSEEVKGQRREAFRFKEVVAELTLGNRLHKKRMTGVGVDEARDTWPQRSWRVRRIGNRSGESSSRRTGWSSSHISGYVGHWSRSAFPAPPSIAGAISIGQADRKRRNTTRPGPGVCGAAFPTRSEIGSCGAPWKNPVRCRGSWQCGSWIRRVTSCPSLQFITC